MPTQRVEFHERHWPFLLNYKRSEMYWVFKGLYFFVLIFEIILGIKKLPKTIIGTIRLSGKKLTKIVRLLIGIRSFYQFLSHSQEERENRNFKKISNIRNFFLTKIFFILY